MPTLAGFAGVVMSYTRRSELEFAVMYTNALVPSLSTNTLCAEHQTPDSVIRETMSAFAGSVTSNMKTPQVLAPPANSVATATYGVPPTLNALISGVEVFFADLIHTYWTTIDGLAGTVTSMWVQTASLRPAMTT